MEEANHTFYWYDLETFGLDRRHDRPAQFAGCRTDADLNFLEGGSGETLYMRPSEDYLPSPESVLLTGITPQECLERGLPEHDFARDVWSRFNAPGTISIGYNTLGFDNEVCRFLFWRNFQDPYSHQWMNGCGIWDLYPVIVAYWALRGEGIVWPDWKDVTTRHPEEERTGVCFRLEELAKANGILHDHAHDALSDVLATVGLARLLKEKAPKFWRWALENRTKAKVIEALGQGPVVCVKTIFGQQRGYTAIVKKLAVNPQSPNEVWVWDLSEDPSNLPNLTQEEWQRLQPVLEGLRGRLTVPLSVDTFYPQVAALACENGADIINDVTGFAPDMWKVAARYGCGCIVMHPSEPDGDVLPAVRTFFEKKRQEAARWGIDETKLCMDPGVGFGKTYEQNLIMLNNLNVLEKFGYPLLLGAMLPVTLQAYDDACGFPRFAAAR